ncbi:MAG: Vitamin B12 transporter BtuB [Xylophilus sp.]|nr:MAG: Vitamin B12 transporter BtuB [Xylophilus sp.]
MHAQESSSATSDVKLDTIVVSGAKNDSPEAAKEKLRKIPGTASVVDNSAVEKGRAANLEDVLAYQPGVLAVATGGSSANLISIRGSGINTFYAGYARGIRYLIDGSPISGPGGTQETLLTPNGVNYTEILNGTNAFTYGALAIGGAINSVTHTGRTAPGFSVGFEGGSYGYVKARASYGGVSEDGATDYYLSVLHSQRDGYQAEAPVKGIDDVVLNVGHTFNSRLKAHFLFRYGQENYRNGGALTLAQIRDNPRQAATGSYGRWSYSALAVGRLEYTFDDDSRLEVALGLNRFNLDNSRDTSTYSEWPSLYISPQIRYFRTNDTLFGLKSDTTFIFDFTQLNGGTNGGNRVPTGSTNKVWYYGADYSGSRDATIGVNNALHLNERTTLTAGLSAVEVKRSLTASGIIPKTSGLPGQVDYDKWFAVPRLGLNWQATPDVQLFTGLGRSIDPPVTWGFPLTSVRAAPGPHFAYVSHPG